MPQSYVNFTIGIKIFSLYYFIKSSKYTHIEEIISYHNIQKNKNILYFNIDRVSFLHKKFYLIIIELFITNFKISVFLNFNREFNYAQQRLS